MKALQTKLMPNSGQVGGGGTTSVLGGPCHAAAIPHLLSAPLTLLSCPSCPSCPCPLCPGATLPTPGGSGGSVNGYHTCKGELSTTEPSPWPFFISIPWECKAQCDTASIPSRREMSLARGWEFSAAAVEGGGRAEGQRGAALGSDSTLTPRQVVLGADKWEDHFKACN